MSDKENHEGGRVVAFTRDRLRVPPCIRLSSCRLEIFCFASFCVVCFARKKCGRTRCHGGKGFSPPGGVPTQPTRVGGRIFALFLFYQSLIAANLVYCQGAYTSTKAGRPVSAARETDLRKQFGLVLPEKLESLTLTLMTQIGGLCHLTTLTEHLRKNWANAARPRALFNEVECHKAIIALTKENSSFVVINTSISSTL